MTSQHTTAKNEARMIRELDEIETDYIDSDSIEAFTYALRASWKAGYTAAIEHTRQENARLREALESPATGAILNCIVCAYDKPWGIWHPNGVAVCVECRDKARAI